MSIERGFRSVRARLAPVTLAFVALAALPAAAQQRFEHRWNGLVFDSTIVNFQTEPVPIWREWTVEDGGRIRSRTITGGSAGAWAFQPVPDAVRDTLRRIFFLDDGLTGWAVGMDGQWVTTADGGATWHLQPQIRDDTDGDPAQSSGPPQELWDIQFTDPQNGWLLGIHDLWWTADGGVHWMRATLNGVPATGPGLPVVEWYSLDVVARPDGGFLGLACGEPGLVLRAKGDLLDLRTWDVVFDARSLCASGGLVGCEQTICEQVDVDVEPAAYEPWDVEISNRLDHQLALMVGGIGVQCGLAFSSADDGLTWKRDPHECECCKNCNGDSAYHCGGGLPGTPKRHCGMKTLYGVGLLDADGTGIAVGYNGQQLVRKSGAVAPGVWEDRSVFASPFAGTGGVVYPLVGADACNGSQTTGRSLLTGFGGYLREAHASADAWFDTAEASPWRIRDAFFISPGEGWQVGQFGRIGHTLDGGVHWTPDVPLPAPATPELMAITFAPDGLHGVAVGDVGSSGKPHILVTDTAGTQGWQTIQNVPGNQDLRDVAWAQYDRFWAVGDGGLILAATNHGANWFRYTPPEESDLHLFQIAGVAFRDVYSGVFVGQRPYPTPADPARGVAYSFHRTSPTPWRSITPADAAVERIAAVVVDDTEAWAVGERRVGDALEGVVLRALWNGDGYGELATVATTAPIPDCTTGEDLTEVAVLTAVAVAPGGDLWIGGKCGRVWRGSWNGSGLALTSYKSQTSAHVRGMSFVSDPSQPAGYVGYLACWRKGEEAQSVVRFAAPPQAP